MKFRTSLLLFLIISGIIFFLGSLNLARAAGAYPAQDCVPVDQPCICPFSGNGLDECSGFGDWALPNSIPCQSGEKFCCFLLGDDSYTDNSCAVHSPGNLPDCGRENVWIKKSKCPEAKNDMFNGMQCTLWYGNSQGVRTYLFDPPGQSGVWDASEAKCIRCQNGITEDWIWADSSQLYGCAGTACAGKPGNQTCESACGLASPECDGADPGSRVLVSGGVCNNCEFASCNTNGLCDGICPANCSIAQDPDCGCQNNNDCCGIGCDSTNDNDCTAPPTGPIAAMKTKIDGKFYIPILNPGSLKVVFLYDDFGFWGDQGGTSGEYQYMPDGTVNVLDQIIIAGAIGQVEGEGPFLYIADANADRKIDVLDMIAASTNLGHSGANYIYDLTNVTINFDSGGQCTPNAQGKCTIPSGATSFTVKKSGNPIGAYILFYSGGGPSIPVCPSDGCNGNCPANCSVDQDPDCGCRDGNNCCGIGCNNLTDNDCPFLVNPFKFGSFQELIEGIINFIFWLAVAIVPIMIMVAAFYFLTSGGDPERIRTAKRIIFWTVIGLAIILLAKGIISVIKQIIGG